MTQLEADLSALKKSKVEDVVLDDGERMSERSDEIALLFKIKLLEEDKNQLEASKETVASLSKENSALKLDLYFKTAKCTTFSIENQRLELCLDQAGRENENLKRRVTELDTTVLSIQDTYNELFCLKEKLILDNDTMDKELLELRSTLNEVSKKRVCELKAELETATKSNSEFQKE